MLPYSSSDAELSAKVALTYPDAFDRSRLAGYLWSLADDAKVTREQAIRALSGLAALGEPVLLRLRKFSEEPDLGWRENLRSLAVLKQPEIAKRHAFGLRNFLKHRKAAME